MNVLVFGSDSTLGSYLAKAVSKIDQITVRQVKWDVRKPITFEHEADVDVVVNCAAITAEYEAQKARYYANSRITDVNAIGAANVALYAKARGAYMIQVSCDSVMGTAGPYWSSEKPYPQDAIAHAKFAGELGVKAVMRTMPYVPHTIIRFGWLYGSRYIGSWPVVAATSKANGPTRVADTSRGHPIHGEDAAAMLLRLIYLYREGAPQEGIVHVGNTRQPVSWFEFLVDHYPYIESRWDVGRRVSVIRGLYPTSVDWTVGFGIDKFKAEMRRHPLWKKDTKRQ